MVAGTMRALLLVAFTLLLSSDELIIRADGWDYGHATYYGGSDASGTNNGACGYSNVFALGYGTLTAALSAPLFQDGRSCGACYQIMCSGDSACYRNSIVVTATNLCPQGSYGGWCDYPKAHFDLSQPAFSQIAAPVAGHVTLMYQRVTCSRNGGIKFNIQGHTYFMQVLVYNVGGMGDVHQVAIKGSRSNYWIYLMRGWGQNWSTGAVLDGQALSIAVTTSDGRTVTSNYVAGQYWQYGQTFQGAQF
uniref:Expansin n=1 Tax=Apopellia endiviifolia (species B) TaxID=119729 RepID=C9WCL0_9MARC|nr:expansin [Apopellia endiviifolia (species B)]ACR38904.1 expansin [Apopellia endiviifolia (species B)]